MGSARLWRKLPGSASTANAIMLCTAGLDMRRRSICDVSCCTLSIWDLLTPVHTGPCFVPSPTSQRPCENFAVAHLGPPHRCTTHPNERVSSDSRSAHARTSRRDSFVTRLEARGEDWPDQRL